LMEMIGSGALTIREELQPEDLVVQLRFLVRD